MPFPRIGIVSDYRTVHVGDWHDLPALLVPDTYVRAVRTARGRPVVIPAISLDRDEIAATLEEIDGLLLIGGRDLDPLLYGQRPDPHTDPIDGMARARDDLERRLLAAAIESGLPTLGICRGAQMLNVTLGGGLQQRFDAQIDDATHRGSPGSFVRHAVQALPDTMLGSLIGDRAVSVASYHHQAIDDVAAPLVASATSEDGLVEALELRDRPFCVGVLWHPEESVPGDGLGLFSALVDAAEGHRARRSRSQGAGDAREDAPAR